MRYIEFNMQVSPRRHDKRAAPRGKGLNSPKSAPFLNRVSRTCPLKLEMSRGTEAPPSRAALQASDAAWKPRNNPWAIAITVTLATFMEVLDTSIANVALPHIAGGLGASQDEATWVLTSYLVSNAVILPMRAYLTSFVGRKRFYMWFVVLFGISYALCWIAQSLPILILCSVLHA